MRNREKNAASPLLKSFITFVEHVLNRGPPLTESHVPFEMSSQHNLTPGINVLSKTHTPSSTLFTHRALSRPAVFYRCLVSLYRKDEHSEIEGDSIYKYSKK